MTLGAMVMHKLAVVRVDSPADAFTLQMWTASCIAGPSHDADPSTDRSSSLAGLENASTLRASLIDVASIFAHVDTHHSAGSDGADRRRSSVKTPPNIAS